MQFPNWAPTVLAQLYKQRLETERRNVEALDPEYFADWLKRLKVEVDTGIKQQPKPVDFTPAPSTDRLKSLLTDSRMESVWNDMRRRLAAQKRDVDDGLLLFWLCIEHAAEDMPSCAETRTAGEREEKLRNIARSARLLADELSCVDLDWPILFLVGGRAREALLGATRSAIDAGDSAPFPGSDRLSDLLRQAAQNATDLRRGDWTPAPRKPQQAAAFKLAAYFKARFGKCSPAVLHNLLQVLFPDMKETPETVGNWIKAAPTECAFLVLEPREREIPPRF